MIQIFRVQKGGEKKEFVRKEGEGEGGGRAGILTIQHNDAAIFVPRRKTTSHSSLLAVGRLQKRICRRTSEGDGDKQTAHKCHYCLASLPNARHWIVDDILSKRKKNTGRRGNDLLERCRLKTHSLLISKSRSTWSSPLGLRRRRKTAPGVCEREYLRP